MTVRDLQIRTPLQSVVVDNEGHSVATNKSSQCSLPGPGNAGLQDEPPFSYRNEIRYFICKGMPLCMCSLMNFGVPPLMVMFLAGHTDSAGSAHLQASLGYARLWYNCTAQMPLSGLNAYFNSVIPGCIGAGRYDRIPRYFQRSALQNTFIMIPFFVLQFAASGVLQALGVEVGNADDVAVYSRLMILTAILTIVNGHFETVLNNLGFVKCTMFTSILAGLCVDSTSNYFLVLRWGMGMKGAALSRILAQTTRLICFLCIVYFYGLFHTICFASRSAEKLFSMREFRCYLSMGIPNLLSYMGGWFIFELQILALTHIRGISEAALAAGSLWIQFEGATAAAQQGWIMSTSMRSLALLGKKDVGASKAFWLFHNLSSVLVAALNVVLLLVQGAFCTLASNDSSVQHWLSQIFWILTLHTQTRLSGLISFIFYIPLGRGMLRTAITFGTFYIAVVPLTVLISLTDIVTTDVGLKLGAVVMATSVAQILQAVCNFIFLCRLDWSEAGEIVNRRANADKREQAAINQPSPDDASGTSLREQ